MRAKNSTLETVSAIRGVIIVSPGGKTGRGGMGSVTREMSRWIERICPEIEVAVIDPRGGGSPLWWPFRLAVAMAQVAVLAMFRRPQVIHLQVSRRSSFVRKGLLLWLGQVLGMRAVLHHHGSEFAGFYAEATPPMQAWVRWVVGRADLNIVLGAQARDYLVHLIGAGADRVFVRANAIADIVDERSVTAHVDPWRLIVVANLMPRKGIETLLKAVAELAQQGAPVRLTLVGDGDIEHYRRIAMELGADERCHFTGWVGSEDVRTLLMSHGALILPSLNEGMPMAILEALSARVPVIATPVGAIPELLEHEQTCLFVQPGDASGLSAAILRLCGEDGLRLRLIANGRRLYEERLEIGAYMADMFALYSIMMSSSESNLGASWSQRPDAE